MASKTAVGLGILVGVAVAAAVGYVIYDRVQTQDAEEAVRDFDKIAYPIELSSDEAAELDRDNAEWQKNRAALEKNLLAFDPETVVLPAASAPRCPIFVEDNVFAFSLRVTDDALSRVREIADTAALKRFSNVADRNARVRHARSPGLLVLDSSHHAAYAFDRAGQLECAGTGSDRLRSLR